MTTEVILTGTGVPHARPHCAGAGTLVRCGHIALQFDAGRSTVMRLMEAGTPTFALSAVFLTHVPDAVAYRVETPDGAVVISGDTRVCDEVEQLSRGANVLVHEACRTTALSGFIAGTPLETIFSYHADTVPLGAMAARAGVPHVMLTHLIPPLGGPEDAAAFEQDLRDGGYEGAITVGTDLATATFGNETPPRPE